MGRSALIRAGLAAGLTVVMIVGGVGSGVGASVRPTIQIRPGSVWTLKSDGVLPGNECEVQTFGSIRAKHHPPINKGTWTADKYGDSGIYVGRHGNQVSESWQTGVDEGLEMIGKYNAKLKGYRVEFESFGSGGKGVLVRGAALGC